MTDESKGRGAIPAMSFTKVTDHCGSWIWDKETRDHQTCHFWRRFDIPKGGEVMRAQLWISAHNAYTVFLDGRELGHGSDWRCLNTYDLTWLLPPGPHVLAVDGFNDTGKAGVLLGFLTELANGQNVEIRSDTNWRVAPLNNNDWLTRQQAPDAWPCAIITKALGEYEPSTNYCGSWIWDKETKDNQTCHFWRRFEIPKDGKVTYAQLWITADNAYTVFLDGRRLGRGSDWQTLSAYDLTWLLPPGPHVLAVDGFNDTGKAGVLLGLFAELANGQNVEIRSDTNWLVVPPSDHDWLKRQQAPDVWPRAIIVGALDDFPWWQPIPTKIVNVPPLLPLSVHFWERGWFQIALLVVLGLTVLTSARLMTQLAVQSKAAHLLQLERARIARDIHDDFGARLITLLVTGEEAQDKLPGKSEARAQFGRMCDGARDMLDAIDEVVWMVNPQRDTLNDSVIYICKYAETFLSAASVRCRFNIPPDLPEISLDLPFRRNIFLTIKESLSNAAKHSGATEVSIRMRFDGVTLATVVEDNGHGFDPLQISAERHGLNNMITRMKDLDGNCEIDSAPGAGCRVALRVPLPITRSRRWVSNWWFGRAAG